MITSILAAIYALMVMVPGGRTAFIHICPLALPVVAVFIVVMIYERLVPLMFSPWSDNPAKVSFKGRLYDVYGCFPCIQRPLSDDSDMSRRVFDGESLPLMLDRPIVNTTTPITSDTYAQRSSVFSSSVRNSPVMTGMPNTAYDYLD